MPNRRAHTQELSIPNADTLVFRFPDTDAELAPDGDDHTFTGPGHDRRDARERALPFGLASARCAATAGLVACVDELYPGDGSCETRPRTSIPSSATSRPCRLPMITRRSATRLGPSAPGAQADCALRSTRPAMRSSPWTGGGYCLRPDGIPVPRLCGTTVFPAFSAVPLNPVRMPGRSFLASYAPSGRRVAPIFDPLFDCSASSNLALFGSVDASVGVMRFARRLANDSGVYQECNGGTNDGSACLGAEDCPSPGSCGPTTCYQANGTPTATACTRDAHCLEAGQVCGPSLFDFSDRLAASGVGPVLIPSAQYALNAQNPVPLEGLLETPSMFAFVELEAIAGSSTGGPTPQDLNDDGDTTDAVLVLRDRKTGAITPIGSTTGEGRAATRIHQAPFSAPAVAVEGDIRPSPSRSEPLEDYSDANLDNDVFDSILRVYRLDDCDCSGTPCGDDLLPSTDLAVDAAPLVEGQSVAVANGRVYFRASEAQNASQTTTRITSTRTSSRAAPPGSRAMAATSPSTATRT